MCAYKEHTCIKVCCYKNTNHNLNFLIKKLIMNKNKIKKPIKKK